MSREKVHGRFGQSEPRPIVWDYTLGVSDAAHAVELGRTLDVLRRGHYGRYKTIEEWVEEMVHPASQDDALKLIARMRTKREVVAS